MLDVKSFVNKVIAFLNKNEIEQKTGIKITVSDEMDQAIHAWSLMFANAADWLSDSNIKSLNLPAEIAAEFARLITIEMSCDVSGSARADYLEVQKQRAFKQLRQKVEYACAKGGMVFKPYVSGEDITIDFIQADCFFPLSFDSSGRMTGAVFIDQIVRGKKIYTRLESHQYDDNGVYIIKNAAYMSTTRNVLGSPVPLTDIDKWADLQPEVPIQNVDRPLFAYFKIPFANQIDPRSALGVSVYSRAVGPIEEADKQWSRFLWENEGAELAIDADMAALEAGRGQATMPKLNKRLFRGLNISGGNSGADFYKVYSPPIRDASLLNGLNAILIRVEDACGLARGTFSDPAADPKTATEILSSKQRSYSSIADCQGALEEAIDDLIYAMDVLATLYNLAPSGAYEVSYSWDDSIVNSPSENKQMCWQYVVAGKFPMWRYLVKHEGYSEEDAREIEAEMESAGNQFDLGGGA